MFSRVQSIKKLVGGWTNPFEKYARQIGSWNPKVRGEHKKYLSNHQPEKSIPIFATFFAQVTWRTTHHPEPIPRGGIDAQDLTTTLTGWVAWMSRDGS